MEYVKKKLKWIFNENVSVCDKFYAVHNMLAW